MADLADIARWQKELAAQPKVFVTWYTRDNEPTGNLYATKEAAELEVEWNKRRGVRVVIHTESLHSLKLSQERWVAGAPKEEG